jgi:hypothetical protein
MAGIGELPSLEICAQRPPRPDSQTRRLTRLGREALWPGSKIRPQLADSVRPFSKIGGTRANSVNAVFELKRQLAALRARRNIEETISSATGRSRFVRSLREYYFAGGNPPKKPAIRQVLPSFT